MSTLHSYIAAICRKQNCEEPKVYLAHRSLEGRFEAGPSVSGETASPYSLSQILEGSSDSSEGDVNRINDAVYSAADNPYVSVIHDPRLGFFERYEVAREMAQDPDEEVFISNTKGSVLDQTKAPSEPPSAE